MLETGMGTINIRVNGENFQYTPIKLPNAQKQFLVDGRFKIVVDNLSFFTNDTIIVECEVINFPCVNVKGYIESGERLALVSFYYGNLKLSIGVEDEIPAVHCEYVDCGLKVTISKQACLQQIVFGIAWVSMQDEEKEDIYTWFAADPTLY